MLKTVTNSINASQIQTPITLPGDVTLSTGNLVIGTSGKGIDFSATPGTGTSELLADYEEGNWSPVINGVTISNRGWYVKVGSVVHVGFNNVENASTTWNNASNIAITGLPFAIKTDAGSGNYKFGGAVSMNVSDASAGYALVNVLARFVNTANQMEAQNISGVNIVNGDPYNMVGSYVTN
jgi:hypothetical protein